MLCQVTGSSPFSIDKFVDHTVTVRAPGVASGHGIFTILRSLSPARPRPPALPRRFTPLLNPLILISLEFSSSSLSLSLSLVSSSSPAFRSKRAWFVSRFAPAKKSFRGGSEIDGACTLSSLARSLAHSLTHSLAALINTMFIAYECAADADADAAPP